MMKLSPFSNVIKDLCWDESNSRFIPRRSFKWLENNHPDLYSEIIELYGSYVKNPKEVHILLSNGIMKYSEIPECHVCNENKCIIHDSKLLDVCSNKCSVKSKKAQDKTRATCMEKYGTVRKWGSMTSYETGTHPSQSGYRNLEDLNNSRLMKHLQTQTWASIAEHFGLSMDSHSSAYKFMSKHGYPIIAKHGKSMMESEVAEYVQSIYNELIELNVKSVIGPYELDLYVPGKKFAIEFNGLYWHSSYSIHTDRTTSKAHLNKTEMCEERGIHLFHIFENEWLDPVKQKIWKSMIANKLGKSTRIYARNCRISEVNHSDYRDFVENNHIQGYAYASKIIGLYYNDQLVQVLSFGKPRFSVYADLELIRACTLVDHAVVGGFSKILKNSNLNPGILLSYANRRWANNIENSNVYDQTGFNKLEIVGPGYFYTKRGEIFNRQRFMKHKLPFIESFDFDNSETERENCYRNGYGRIWDSGNILYTMEIK